ncbi:MAG: Ig-like domain-containing protein, partial [Saprospiraceae bacterium]|nr:Ig-like domain-containing protein [Saprospiraceae bacterium]
MKTLCLLFALFLSGYFLHAQSIEVKQSDKIKTDGGTVGKANAGDVIQYKVKIENTGGANANGVKLNAVPDAKTTFVNSSFVSTSVAVNDAYTCTGNVGINVPAANGVLSNDFDDNLGGATLTCNTCNPTTNGGTITLHNDGSFMYVPAAGYTGSDQFTYTINDATIPDGATPIAGDITATVNITISNMIWFIDNSSVAALSDGRRSSPFKTLASFESVNGTGGLNPAAGHTIYIEHTGINYSGGVSLEDNQIVIGEGHTGTSTMVPNENLSVALSFALAPFSLALPNIDGTRPVIVNAGGDGVTLAANNNLRGFDIGNCQDFGIDDNGNVGTLSINEVSINNGAGGGIRADAGGTLAVTLGSVSSTGGANGVNLNNVGGNFTVSNATSITNSTSAAVTIANNTSTVSFNTLNITNTTSNQTGILASGGTINSSSGTINTGSGRAVDIDNTTLGMMLTAVSCNGCTTGIDLNTTTGSFAVNGTGMAGTGGTIRNGAIGISLTSTRNVSLAWMQLNDFSDFAIRGNSVINFTLNNAVVNGVNGNN